MNISYKEISLYHIILKMEKQMKQLLKIQDNLNKRSAIRKQNIIALNSTKSESKFESWLEMGEIDVLSDLKKENQSSSTLLDWFSSIDDDDLKWDYEEWWNNEREYNNDSMYDTDSIIYNFDDDIENNDINYEYGYYVVRSYVGNGESGWYEIHTLKSLDN